MRAHALVVAEGDGHGGTMIAGLRSEAPLMLRETPGALYLVGGAGGPLGGDRLTLEIDVGPAARLTVRTAAASVALPGPCPSSLEVRARVAAGGELWWLPEPLVAGRACDHRMSAVVDLEEGARLVWREEVVLGRHGEDGGSVRARSTVDLGSEPLFRHEVGLGPLYGATDSPAVTAGARAVGSVLVVDERATLHAAPVLLQPTAAILPLARAGVQVVALAGDASTLRRQLDAGLSLS